MLYLIPELFDKWLYWFSRKIEWQESKNQEDEKERGKEKGEDKLWSSEKNGDAKLAVRMLRKSRELRWNLSMRTSTLALFRDFHDDNRPAQDPQGETSKKTGGKERMTGVAQGVAEGSEGMCTTNLFLWRSGKSTLVIQRVPEGRLFHVSYGAICLMISSSRFVQPPSHLAPHRSESRRASFRIVAARTARR